MSYRETVEREKHEVIGKGRVRTEKGKKTKKETYNQRETTKTKEKREGRNRKT